MGWARAGCRAYIAVAGGIDVPLVLGSRATYAPALLGGHTAPNKVSARTDRVACRLSGPALDARARIRSADEGSGPTDIIEDGNAIGAIRIAGGTEAIIMLRDAPSTGAYAKIACLVAADLDAIAQAKPDDRVRFRSVAASGARERLLARPKALAEALDAIATGGA
jgi:allophanate hydrolase subunit 2